MRRALSGYLDRRISQAERALVATHLARCRECAARLAEMAELRNQMRAFPVAATPLRLETELQVIASRERVRAAERRTPAALLRAWAASLRLGMDNLMRPLAVPFAGGLISALLLFTLLVPVLGFRPVVSNDVPTVLYTSATLVEVGPLSVSDDDTVVELFVDAKGMATDYTVQRGQVTPEIQADLNNLIFFSRFTPATWFGQPTSGKLLVSFRRVLYTVRG